MKKLLVLDEKNYGESLEEIYRIAVRGIIYKDGRLLMIESDDGELKFPGGGMEEGEDYIQTLIRETMEETGFSIVSETVREFGEIEEKRLALYEKNKIWHQINRYYCEVADKQSSCDYSENEKAHGFKPVWYTLDEAYKKNCKRAWVQREYHALKLLKEYFK
ncbi:MAG: NUDIX domain-containing protein [Oscillospiraceae bacterium]|nr:NUDIX domain-containing protein [Oscillospiraceae bacterium]